MAKKQKSNKKRKQQEAAEEIVSVSSPASSDSQNKETEASSNTQEEIKQKANKKQQTERVVNKKEKKGKSVIDNKSSKKEVEFEEEEEEKGALYTYPMNRISRIIKSGNPDIRMFTEAVFLVNKASEKFVQLFSTEAYAYASQDGKKKVDYKHLSSVIPQTRRFDFLSDFVPEKVKVEDALKEMPSVET